MLDFVWKPLTDYLVASVGDPSQAIAAARSAAQGEVLWSGAQLSGGALRSLMEQSGINMTCAAAAVLLGLALFVAGQRNHGRGGAAGPAFFVCGGVISFLGLVFCLIFAGVHSDLVAQARTGIAIEPARLVMARDGTRSDFPASALSMVSRNEGSRSVSLRFGASPTFRVGTDAEGYGGLTGAADPRSAAAGAQAPLKKDDLG